MRFLKQAVVTPLAISMLVAIAFAADLDFPYANFRLKLPPSENPFPGLGNYYSTLSKGMKSVLWNPASLGKLKLSEASFSTISALKTYNYERSFNISEYSGTFEAGGGSSAGEYALFFRYPENIGTGINTKEVEVMAHTNYATSGTGINFTSALKINDWLMIGFAANNPLEVGTDLAGDFPLTARAVTNFYGQQIGDEIQIDTAGRLKYTFTSNGTVTTCESIKPIWNGFLSQEVTIPLTSLSELRNNINIQSPYIGSIASKFGNLSLGLNMIPIYATVNIDNDVRTVVRADTQDRFFYIPDFDPENETERATWINDPDKYATSDGYKRRQIKLPTGEIISTTKYRGFYTASTTRLDIGAMYDITDWLTVGLVLENMSGSSLNFKGNGIATYINYRDIDTAEVGSVEDLIKPGGETPIELITNRWVTTTEVQDTKLYLEPEKSYDLPKRIRYGIALKKPFLIAIDFEQNQTPIKIKTVENNQPKEYTISNINLIRIGMETQFSMLPLWLRGGITFISKPTVTGLDADAQKNFDSAFQSGVLPLKLDLGSDSNFWGTIIGGSFGINGQSLLNLIQFDTTNIDLSKLIYFNTYIRKDAWQISYLLQVDPLGTAAAYGMKMVPAGQERQEKEFKWESDLKFIQTLGVTYRF